ncbi:diguanylate cyclase [Clostridium chromiireducens]|uniref:Diguanylate cyclase n=1 Tax=Clostridium chromiireducens TaxID=225345 RepID=A0A964RIZ9_9CLOT|nr:diguanylate cyclase [Clostridium chromiireducens]MVX62461.1 diguanylate cyclase [Clostridium chromiireducens]
MNFTRFDKKSIIFKLTSFVIVIIIFQAILLIATIVLGGVLSQGKDIAYSSLSDKVSNRKDYMQREMSNRWINMDAYVSEISKSISKNGNNEIFFSDAAKYLISMLRTTQTTGVFLILNDENNKGEHSALYLRDYDPLFNDYNNKDLYFLIGPYELAKEINVPLDEDWNYRMKLTEDNEDFYRKPYEKAYLSNDSRLLSYWSVPFKLFPKDQQIITYSEPFFDKDNNLRGVIGVEISVSYLTQSLPATDLQQKDSLGYLIGYKRKNEDEITPVIMTGALQKRMIDSDKKISLTHISPEKDIYRIENSNSKDDIYGCIEKIGLYKSNTPFEEEEWYLVGMMTEHSLFSHVLKIKNILWISLSISILIGIIGGYIISYKFTKPIIKLAKQVRESDKSKAIRLEATGLSEVDELSRTIQFANNALLESTVKMSQIIDLVGVPIGAYEYKEERDRVFVTDQLKVLLSIDDSEMIRIVSDKALFIEKINKILSRPHEEDGVYIVSEDPDKYVKFKTVKNSDSTIGVVLDVTEEILEKNMIKEERDYDPLTKIYNRKAIQIRIQEMLSNIETLGTCGILMFDLDNLKTMNDTYGHKWGDIYIKAAVEQLKTIGNDKKVLGRRSGDEFVLFLYGFSNKEELKALIDNFYINLENYPLNLPDGKVKTVTISAGLMWVESAELTYDELLHYADEALYKAKKSYKGTCCIHESL